MEIPDVMIRCDLFRRVIQNMVDNEKIALEDGVIRLFRNSKENRTMFSNEQKQPQTRHYRRGHTIEIDDDEEVAIVG